MRRFRPLLALLLLSLWLPATMHCGFEALGTLFHFDGNLCDDKEACRGDACDLLENGGYSGAVEVINVTPVLVTEFALWREMPAWPVCILLPAAEPEKPPVEFEMRSLPDWQFARRAALLPGAPQFRLT